MVDSLKRLTNGIYNLANIAQCHFNTWLIIQNIFQHFLLIKGKNNGITLIVPNKVYKKACPS